MIQKTKKIFKNKTYCKGPKHKYITNKTDVYHVVDIWRLNLLDLKIIILRKIVIIDLF